MAYQEILNSEIQTGAPIDPVLLAKIKGNDEEFNQSTTSLMDSLGVMAIDIQNTNVRITNLESKLGASDLIEERVATTSFTLAIDDRNKLIAFNHATVPGVITIPTHASVALPIGTQVSFVQSGAAQLSIAAASGVTISTEVGLKLNAVNAMASIIKVGTNTWRLTGSLKA